MKTTEGNGRYTSMDTNTSKSPLITFNACPLHTQKESTGIRTGAMSSLANEKRRLNAVKNIITNATSRFDG